MKLNLFYLSAFLIASNSNYNNSSFKNKKVLIFYTSYNLTSFIILYFIYFLPVF